MSELNLIPSSLKRKNSFLSNRRNRIICICVILALFLVGVVLPIIELNVINSREKKLQEEIKAGEGILKESEEIKKEISEYKTHIASVEIITKLLPDAEAKIRGLEKYMTGDVSFSSLAWGNGIITIQAKSNSYNSLCVFAANLQESKEYSEARINGIDQEQDKAEYTCSISIKY